MIYYVEGCCNHIKIGFAKNPARRLRALQSGSPSPLNLLAIEPGTPADERRLHRRFSRHRGYGEWFRPAPELLAHVNQVRRSVDKADSAGKVGGTGVG